jgi:hypothetical protein
MLLIGLVACTSEPDREVTPAFYHWKSYWKFGESDSVRFAQIGIKRSYVRFFDVNWSVSHREARPAGRASLPDTFPAMLSIVPVVFISNQSIIATPAERIPDLARLLTAKLLGMRQKHQASYFPEVQIDCDWTDSSREAYFTLLEVVKQELAQWPDRPQLSITVRLYQVKYFERSGVPPADRALLMCYNLKSPTLFQTANSLFNLPEAKQYLHRVAQYPLPADIALPVFSWGVLFREGRFVGLLNQWSHQKAAALPQLIPERENWYRVKEAFRVGSTFFQPHDLIRIEEVLPAENKALLKYLHGKLPKRNLTLLFYHYDAQNLLYHDEQTFRQMVDILR